MLYGWSRLLLVLLLAREPAPPLHKVEVRIAGPLAMVEVWRSVAAGTRTDGNRQVATFLDLSLPEGAALLDWEVVDNRKRIPLAPQSPVQANHALVASLKLRRLSLATNSSEEGAHYRIHLVPVSDGEKAVLHYRYAAPVGCREGRLVLRVPESLEEYPEPAEVTVTLDPLPSGSVIAEARLASQSATLRPDTRHLTMRGLAPGRAAWEIAWKYAGRSGTLPGQALAAAARVTPSRLVDGRERTVPGYAVVGALCRGEGAPVSQFPAQVLLLVDRSRSVGQGGLSAERALARALMEALPPSVPFNAVLFGREAVPLFALPRMPTREALDALVNAADPNRLENGTDVVAALLRAGGLVDLGTTDGTAPAWLVLITDGALTPGQTFDHMQAALSAGKHRNLRVLVLLVRQQGDDEVPVSAVAEYAMFARKFGGLVRVVPPGSLDETAHNLLAAMAKGGDLLEVRLEDKTMADVVSPGQGARAVFALGARPARLRFTLRALDGEAAARVAPVMVKKEWVDPLVNEPSGRQLAWTGATDGMAISILPSLPAVRPAADAPVRGRMDPLVLRNALSLAFMPRARACYLSRRVAKAGDAYLRGRVKLELTLERGELHDAVVRSSTLDNAFVEDCVRDAAWAIEYPRPEHRDAPTIANLNLVFQPHTPQERKPDASALDRDIDLILGPLTFPEDGSDLLQDKPAEK